MKASIENGTLILRVPMQTPTPSKSTGKTFIVATSHGNQRTEAQLDGKNVVVSVNAFIYPTAL